MDRVMSVEERIRRAEDIYNRRNAGYARINLNDENNERKKRAKNGKFKKLFMQIFVCISIYIIFYAVTNREYVFSKEFRSEVNTFFVEKTKISEIYSKAKEFIKNKFHFSEEENEKKQNLKSTETEQKNENIENKKEDEKENKTEENIGGAIESKEAQKEENTDKEKLSEQQLMEKDANAIKQKISFIVPVNGRISSTFGWRNPTTTTVPKYHTGLDIAAVEGTIIKSATDGKVIMASSQGDYGNHYQIQIQDIILVYAHCKKLYLKVGDTVKQGQKIAEVGTTGNSTGPHLHFEIRKDGRKIDPQLILDF